ncbi:MAG TPA: hemerythrin domain-containing protein, partial [Bacteroidia bacterium]|nr:hemerythrin domain-containing protein [Bacteroidia bacterium]
MKRHPALITLSREHHDGLVIAQVLKSDVPAYRGMPDRPADRLDYFKARFVTALKPHFISEEQYLFPMLKGRDAGVDDLLNRLTEEHRELETATRLAAGDPELESRLDA